MERVSRIGVSLEPDLLAEFDGEIQKKGYVSRSEAIRDLIRDALAERDLKNDDIDMLGVLVVVFDARVRDIFERKDAVYRRRRENIISATRMDLDGGNMMEIVASRGKLRVLKEIANELSSLKGVRRARLTMAAPETGNLHHVGVRNRGRRGARAARGSEARRPAGGMCQRRCATSASALRGSAGGALPCARLTGGCAGAPEIPCLT